MSTHLGRRVTALLDGRLSPAETEAAWEHVHGCHSCRDDVEREGWVKTRLSTLSYGGGCAPDHLKGALLGMPPGDCYLRPGGPSGALGLDSGHDFDNRSRGRRAGIAALGGSAVGAAVVGVLALGTAPADAPSFDRRMQPTPQVQVTQNPATRVPVRLPR
ncbi:zf-HC2 domain-containing protein [Nocardioides sp. GXZ039]|uniref:zf-HC2 domain-containing protein n=1 Tax=Nocardioides sp. GXZ039 TaxID=3136018 RepID=UPI0030F3B6CC